MKDIIAEIDSFVKKSLLSSKTMAELDELKVSILGRKGKVTELFKKLSLVKDIEEKKSIGQKINDLKNFLEEEIDKRKKTILEKEFASSLEKSKIDITLPGRLPSTASVNILTQVEEEIVDIFASMGFTVAEGWELEDDFHNFQAMNIPYYHPTRDSHDTFYVSKDRLLRTHTSGMQIRMMKETPPPIAALSPGKCARRDAIDPKHSPVFHQVEGLLVDKNVSFNDLKGTLDLFCKKMFGNSTKTRFRPDFFPFVEPGADLSASCVVCGGKGCKTCGYEGWIELMGSGMIHPNVFEYAGYDSTIYSGYAFGVGIERVAMIKYGITDIRMFYDNDLDFLKQW